MAMGRGLWRSSLADPWVEVGNGSVMYVCAADKNVTEVSISSDIGVDDESCL